MPLTVGGIIESARHEDPSFTTRRHTNYVLRSRLAEYQAELVSRLSERDPDEFVERYVVPLPLADFDAGHPLLDPDEAESLAEPLQYLRILDDAEALAENGNREPCRFIPFNSRWEREIIPPLWIRNGRLYLGGQERNWECFTEVRIHYIPKPPVQLTDADEPILVHRARALYVAYLAWRMATRGPKEIQGSLGDMRGHYLELEQRLVDEFTGRHHVHERVRVTY